MQRLKRFIFLTLLLILFFPSITKAHNFNQTDSLFFNTNDRLYRQKTVQRPWQLILLPEQSRIKQAISFDEEIWLVLEINSRQYLYRQNRLLSFEAIESISSADETVLKATEKSLIIFQLNGTETKLTIFQAEGKFEHITTPLVDSKSELERLVEINGTLLYLKQVDSQVIIFEFFNQSWRQSLSINCDQSLLIQAPIVGIYCRDGGVFRLASVNQWTRLNLTPVDNLYSSDEILAGWDKVDQNLFHIWHVEKETNIVLPTLSVRDVDETVVDGNRVLFKKKSGNWHELRWQLDEPKLVELPDTSTGIVIPIAESSGIIINGTKPLLSLTDESWQVAIVSGSFNTAYQTKLGLLIWNNGSLTQFAPNGSTAFTKVNPWSSTTSPIRAVKINPDVSYISVVTQSGNGNTNMYKTTDYLRWSRITLPTKPTLSPTVSQTRSLATGSLVEIAGVITVGPKVVDKEVLYLEDETGGIQIFLSQTGGLLPTQTKIKAIVTGEISTSQTKRVLLNSLTDLELGSASFWNEPIIDPDQATTHLGRSVRVKGQVKDVETDSLTLGNLKIHFVGAKTIFQKDDQLIIPSVIDWNSASGHNEAWALSTDYQLIFRNQSATSTTTTVSSSVSEGIVPKKTTVSKKSTSSTPKASSKTVPTVAETLKPSDTPVIVAGAQSNNRNTDNRTISMSLVSLIAGLVSFRGRRFRRWLPD